LLDKSYKHKVILASYFLNPRTEIAIVIASDQTSRSPEPFDMPTVRPESFDKAQDRLVEACGGFRRTRNGWHTQDRIREGVAI
jgi:hypothetical protein